MMKHRPKIIVIDGMDGSGKATQSELLQKWLINMSCEHVHLISFPRYGHESCSLVDTYLKGRICENPMEVNPYAASMCYALDRYISYKTYWEKWLEEDCDSIIIFDRYISSNILHQAIKIPESTRPDFIKWVYDTEINLFGLPKPDIEIFLQVDASTNMDLINHRNHAKDIHENIDLLQLCHGFFNSMMSEGGLSNFKVVNCQSKEGNLRSIEDIHKEIIQVLRDEEVIVY